MAEKAVKTLCYLQGVSFVWGKSQKKVYLRLLDPLPPWYPRGKKYSKTNRSPAGESTIKRCSRHPRHIIITRGYHASPRPRALNSDVGSQQHLRTIPSAMEPAGTAVGPGRAHSRQAGAPTGRMTSHPSKKHAEKTKQSPLTAGVLLCAKSLKAFHIASNVAYGRVRCHQTRVHDVDD